MLSDREVWECLMYAVRKANPSKLDMADRSPLDYEKDKLTEGTK